VTIGLSETLLFEMVNHLSMWVVNFKTSKEELEEIHFKYLH
jgi:hypothetical protein